MNLQNPLRYKIEGKWLWTKFGAKETWGKVYYVGNETKISITNQRFGANATPIYNELGYKGHTGTDWTARNFTCLYSPCDGVVSAVLDLDSVDPNDVRMGKIEIQFTADGNLWKWLGLHICDSFVKKGDKVMSNQLIGLTGNTGGKYTTGSHLHSGLYELDASGAVLNHNNGYQGAIDDYPYYDVTMAYKTDELKSLYEFSQSTGLSYLGWGGSDNFALAKKKLGITGVTIIQYLGYLIKGMFNK